MTLLQIHAADVWDHKYDSAISVECDSVRSFFFSNSCITDHGLVIIDSLKARNFYLDDVVRAGKISERLRDSLLILISLGQDQTDNNVHSWINNTLTGVKWSDSDQNIVDDIVSVENSSFQLWTHDYPSPEYKWDWELTMDIIGTVHGTIFGGLFGGIEGMIFSAAVKNGWFD